MARLAKENNHRAVGLSDHGTLAGAIQFIKACREFDVKPVLGIETYLCRKMSGKSVEEQPDKRRGNRHLNLFAKNFKGYQNLCTLSQRASLDGYYYDPRIDIELLSQYSSDLICSTACLSNVINWNLLIDRYEEAKLIASVFKDIFGEDFYLEIMYHGLDEEAKIIPDILKLSQELEIKSIITGDTHYAKKEDAKYHEAVLAISSNKCLKDPSRIHFPYDEFYFKSTEEICKIFGGMKESIKNTVELAEKCDLSDLRFGGMNLPNIDLPEGFSNPFEYLKYLAYEGLKNKKLDKKKEYIERLDLELSDVKLIYDTKKYDFSTYFLIVEDIVRFTKNSSIPIDIRGSGNGSLLLYVLGISSVDPIFYHGLLWSRFLGFDAQVFFTEADFGIK